MRAHDRGAGTWFAPSCRSTGMPREQGERAVTIRVAVVDDQTLVRSGFAMILGANDDIDVVAVTLVWEPTTAA